MPARTLRPPLRRLLTVAAALAAVGVVWWQRGVIVDAIDELGALSSGDLATIVGCWLLWSAARAMAHHLALPRGRWTHALVLSEVGQAAHSLPAGAMSELSARIAIGRSFGRRASTMSVSLLLVSEALATGLWLVVLATSLRDVLSGDAGNVERGAVGVSLAAIVATVVIAYVITRRTRLSDALVRAARWLQRRVARRWQTAGRFDIERFVAEAQRDAGEVVRTRWHALAATGVVTVVASGLLLAAAVRALGVDADGWELWGGFALATAAIGFAPTPGGVGIAETAMGTMLVAAGATPAEAVAAVVIHRGFTFVLPLLTGALTFVGWSRWTGRRERPLVDQEISSADQ